MISVIGAGPAGSFYSSKVKDADVCLFEEHTQIGRPVACTGILTDSINRVTRFPRDLIINYVKQFKIIAPNNKATYIDLKKKNYVIDRAGFDQHLFERAVDNGAQVHLGERFTGYKKTRSGYQLQTNKKKYETDMIVGADGPKSAVAQAAGLYGKRQFIKGWQARCRFPALEPGVTQIHLNLGEFSWIVPENEHIARVGVIGADTARLQQDYKKLLGNATILEDQSGIIPLYNPKQTLQKDKISLIGDAATQVKATTYGGIIYGLLAGTYLSENPATYQERFNNKLGRDLWISLKMREWMNTMNEEQSNTLIDIFQKKHNIDILANHDRDFPSKFIVQLLLKETSLWKLGFDMFKNKLFSRKQ
ncbi:geranylgeranyl reductase family protein [Candidatus Woesearchaeota archaeon]|nr:geranylgeranyl reductase family protein [Candidatus Woesearchaeota archaeon]